MNQAESTKFQVQKRLKKIMSPNDKLTRTVFNLPEHEFFGMIFDGADNYVTENPKSRRAKVKTKFWLENVGTCELSEPLNEYDRAIFDACMSAYQAKFDGITDKVIFRAMTGGKEHNAKLYSSQRAAVLKSIERMMSIRITIDFSQACAAMKRYCGAAKKLVSTILPCKYVDGVEFNGQNCAVIYFLDESPLLTIARVKKQMLTYDVGLLGVPNQNNTKLVTKVKSYLVRRVAEIKAHKMTTTITFADVFGKCGLDGATNGKKRDVRKLIRDVFEQLKNQGVIRAFELEKVDGVYRAIKFQY